MTTTREDDCGRDRERAALLGLLGYLRAQGYRFVTPTPATHARVVARPGRRVARSLRDVFGWSLPFERALLPTELLGPLEAAGLIVRADGLLRSRVRVSALGPDLFVHSAYPTDDPDAVFFGPDSYRFARLIERELARCPRRAGARLADIGAGAGVGAIVAARRCAWGQVVMTDINPGALRLARINAEAAGVATTFLLADGPSALDGAFDLILANPPYIVDGGGRTYRDGGGLHGAQVSLGMARGAVPRLAEQGRFVLYTGSAIVDGADALRRELAALAGRSGCRLRYAELDPDVFGEELAAPAYRDVDRIALVAAVLERIGTLR